MTRDNKQWYKSAINPVNKRTTVIEPYINLSSKGTLKAMNMDMKLSYSSKQICKGNSSRINHR